MSPDLVYPIRFINPHPTPPQRIDRSVLPKLQLNPILPRGGADSAPWETFLNNSVTTQDIEMKFFKFNLTPMGVILHMVTILINLRCCDGNLSL